MRAEPAVLVLGGPLSLPLEEPVLVFALALAVFLVAPLLIKRLGQPGIVGIVLFGVAIGPGALGLLDESEAIVLLGEVGLVYLLFTVGLEIDLRGFLKAPENAALFGLTSFFVPLVVGVGAGYYVLGLSEWAALLLAAVFASHTLLAYPIANRLDITDNRAVTAVFGGILFTDTLALVVLAIVIGAIDGGLTLALFVDIAVSLAILFASVLLVVPPIARWFFQNLSDESYYEFLFVVVALFAAASLAEVLDISGILGAFVAGLALNRQIPRGGTLMNRVEFVGNAFFIPFFLLYVGILVNPAVIFDGLRTLEVAGVVVVVMLATKAVAAWIVATIQGYDRNELGVIFGLSTGQAAAALAITLIGYEAGLFGDHVLNAVVLMLLVTAVVSPWLTERFGTRLALDADVDPGGEDALDPRILLPLSTDADRRRRLLELAFVLKDRYGTEPVHLLTVVPPRSGKTETRVAEVERDLENAAEFGGAAEIPVEVETRVNHNVASGIVRGSVETRADTIVIGWDASRTFGRRIFGSTIDQVLRRTTVPVVVSRLGHPINTTQKLYVVVPPGLDHHEGFYEAVHTVKRLAIQLGTPMTVLVVEGSPRQYERLFGLVEQELTAEFDEVDSWGSLLPELSTRTGSDDLIIVMSPREGSVGWHSELGELPGRLVELPPESFITIYPREDEPEYDATFLKIE
ncbi:cation:proton antiporter [Natrialbaceae archaeon AArc-T1-2]|uniref:cation:proton antiporter n=1 Tax=Natrialbaceae archaeon AArc-T1-2 TaxID=3053904 RepID=UPI00255A9817|nr:cation:proton antiporter [Natrialbaceae archaeon AArc-T1-2]WIV67740.1 cation:proton antiporter [Natrialbaceae archaeon AArc-T1-2]